MGHLIMWAWDGLCVCARARCLVIRLLAFPGWNKDVEAKNIGTLPPPQPQHTPLGVTEEVK